MLLYFNICPAESFRASTPGKGESLPEGVHTAATRQSSGNITTIKVICCSLLWIISPPTSEVQSRIIYTGTREISRRFPCWPGPTLRYTNVVKLSCCTQNHYPGWKNVMVVPLRCMPSGIQCASTPGKGEGHQKGPIHRLPTNRMLREEQAKRNLMDFMQDPLPSNLRTAVRHDIHVGDVRGAIVRRLSKTPIHTLFYEFDS